MEYQALLAVPWFRGAFARKKASDAEILSCRFTAGCLSPCLVQLGQRLLHFLFSRLAAQASFELLEYSFSLSFLFASHRCPFSICLNAGLLCTQKGAEGEGVVQSQEE